MSIGRHCGSRFGRMALNEFRFYWHSPPTPAACRAFVSFDQRLSCDMSSERHDKLIRGFWSCEQKVGRTMCSRLDRNEKVMVTVSALRPEGKTGYRWICNTPKLQKSRAWSFDATKWSPLCTGMISSPLLRYKLPPSLLRVM
nr:hypothetical protein CFP56_24349 [Quercus suber]